MGATVTVTGDVGPGQAVSALVLQNCSQVNFKTENADGKGEALLEVYYKTNDGKPLVQQFDIKDQNTVTVTKSGTTWTFTIAA
jgi:hypothetical protein